MLFLASAIRALLSFSSFLPVALAKRAKACWKSGRQRQLSWFQNLRIPHAQTHMNYHEFISSTRIECRMSIYLAKKVPIYRRFAFRKQSHPIRCSETFRNQRWTVDAQSNHRSMLRLFGGFQKYFWSKFQGYIHRHPISHDAGLRTLCKNHHNLSWLQDFLVIEHQPLEIEKGNSGATGADWKKKVLLWGEPGNGEFHEFLGAIWASVVQSAFPPTAQPSAVHGCDQHHRAWTEDTEVGKWVCLKIGYIPNYSHLIGIMIINHWV